MGRIALYKMLSICDSCHKRDLLLLYHRHLLCFENNQYVFCAVQVDVLILILYLSPLVGMMGVQCCENVVLADLSCSI